MSLADVLDALFRRKPNPPRPIFRESHIREDDRNSAKPLSAGAIFRAAIRMVVGPEGFEPPTKGL